MNDLTMLITFLTKTGTKYTTFSNPKFMDDEAVERKAVLCISIRDYVHIYFNTKGIAVGSSTDCSESFREADNR